MPVWNSNPAHFAVALDSLLGQSLGDFEIILADNGSAEPARQMYIDAAARDSRIRLLRHDNNTGAIANFRFVLEQARGELFMWAADDDSRSPRLLAEAVAALDRRPDCVTAGPLVAMIDEDGKRIGRADIDMRHVSSPSPARRMLGVLAGYENMDVYALHRRRMLQDLDLTMQTIWLDRHMLVDILLHGPVVRLEEELFYYRMSKREESYARRVHQHFGEGALSELAADERNDGADDEDADLPRDWQQYDYAGTAFRLLATVLQSKAPLSTGERAESFASLAMVLLTRGWFTRDRLYKLRPALKGALRRRDAMATLRLGLQLLATSPSFPFVVAKHRAMQLLGR
jgi:glycosyltransferase involved in cell wall biosynthesis